jgi:chromosome segregation protein
MTLRINKLSITGFKSFPEKTEIFFDSKGITGVVGPNGCGKSNIADAIGWVIGEQRVKMLRGSKMEDVIFQGTNVRAPSGVAQVTLTLLAKKQPDNNHHDTDTSSPDRDACEEITVTRQLFKTGESEYIFNGKTSRLRDIQDFFAGTGLGASHYAIIEQGRIGQVLSSKPNERRLLIEEAADISKFKARQRISELKLEGIKNNLSRVQDIILEVDKNISSLKRQAAKAQRFRKLRHVARKLQTAAYIAEYKTLTEKAHNVHAEIKSLLRSDNSLSSKVNTLTQDALAVTSSLLFLADRENQEQQRLLIVTSECERLDSAQSENSLKKSSALERLENLNQSLRKTEDRVAVINLESQKASIAEHELLKQIQSISDKIQSCENQASKLKETDLGLVDEVEGLRANFTEISSLCERWQQMWMQADDLSKRVTVRATELTKERERVNEELSTIEAGSKITNDKLAKDERTHSILTNEIRSYEDNILLLTEHIQSRKSEILNSKEEFSSIQNKLTSLLNIAETKADYSESVQQLIKHSQTMQLKVRGTLSDFIEVPSDSIALAVQRAFARELEALVVEDHNDALGGITYLHKTPLGQAFFIVLKGFQDITTDSNASVRTSVNNDRKLRYQTLSEFISFQLPFPQQITDIFNKTFYCESIEEAIQISQEMSATCITRDGDRVTHGHLLQGGYLSDPKTGLLTIRRTISQLQENSDSLKTAITINEMELSSVEKQYQELIHKSKQMSESLLEREQSIAILRERASQTTKETERLSKHLQIINRELQIAEEEIKQENQKALYAKDQYHETSQKQSEIKRQLTTIQEQASDIKDAQNTASSELLSLATELATLSEKRRSLQNDIKRLATESTNAHNVISSNHLDIAQIKETLALLNSQSDEIEEQKNRSSSLKKEIQTTLSALKSQIESLKETEANINEEVSALKQSLSDSRETRARLEIEEARLTTNIQHVSDNCKAETAENIEDLLKTIKAASEMSTGAPLPQESLVPEADGTDSEDDNEGISDPEHITEAYSIQQYSDEIALILTREDLNIDEIKDQVSLLKKKIDQLGPVNLVALQELEEARERRTFLESQRNDIEQGARDIQAAINEIKKKSREQFAEAFSTINSNFQKTFAELFGGGRGEMRLIDEDDILDSGIEIIAQPPGKRLQNVLLLSGGEKAMTAIALVMAIFKYRPSPFCLLDEVDAPLDEANIGRFIRIIQEMSEETQFLLITHSKKTMEAAGTLYGVTMEEPGVSRLVSVRLTQGAATAS